MTIPEFPTARIARVTRRLMAAATASTSPFTGTQQVQDWGGRWWACEIDCAVLNTAEGRALAAVLAGLGGPAGRFLLADPSTRSLQERRNLVLWSSDLRNPAWTTTGGDTSGPFITGPDGALSGMPLAGTADGAFQGRHSTSSLSPFRSGAVATSIWARAGATDWLHITMGMTGGKVFRARFDLATGTPGGTSISSGVTDTDGGMIPGPDGWWRCWSRCRPGGADTHTGAFFMAADGNSNLGAVGTGIHLFGPQIEPGLFPTTWQPTGAAEITVDGPGQSGSLLATDGWPAGAAALAAGDFLSLGTGADTRLHQITAEATADGAGKAALALVPPLRFAPAGGAPVEIAAPKLLLRLTAPVAVPIERPERYRIALSAREAI